MNNFFHWKKHWRFDQKLDDYNSHDHWNIFCTDGRKRKATWSHTVVIMKIMKLAGVMCRGVLVKDYAVYIKWMDKWMIALQLIVNNNFFLLTGSDKINVCVFVVGLRLLKSLCQLQKLLCCFSFVIVGICTPRFSKFLLI